jgi:hypothetical protein
MTKVSAVHAGGAGGVACGVVINEAGASVDLRVEGDTDANLLFADGSADSVGIGTNAPSAFLNLKAGTATAEKTSLKFTSGVNLATPEAGAIEYDGKIFYSTPAARGVSPSEQFVIVPAAGFNLQRASGVQSAFQATGDVITVEADTSYFFEGLYYIDLVNAQNLTCATAFALGGGASLTSIAYRVYSSRGGINGSSTPMGYFTITESSSIVTLSRTDDIFIYFKGLLRVNAAGTITPQINMSDAPTTSAKMVADSFIRFFPIGSKTVQLAGNVA